MNDMTEKPDSREAILEAASKRILHYGYNKTTISEIAADCGMSAGNIYRFFPSKLDIAEAMARDWDVDSNARFDRIVQDASLTPMEKLKKYFSERFELVYARYKEHPKLSELAEFIGRERPDYVQERLALERKHIGMMLEEGVAAGEIVLPYDTETTADVIQCAMSRFQAPFFFEKKTHEMFQFELEGVLHLLLHGLETRE